MEHYGKVCEDIIEFWNQDCEDVRSKKIKNKRHYFINSHMMENHMKWSDEESTPL